MPDHTQEFITEEEAREIAMDLVTKNQDPDDPVFSKWRGSIAGTPLLVRTLSQNPSYWIVPLTRDELPTGFIRILGNGQVIHMGIVPQDPGSLPESRGITGMTREEAERRVGERFSLQPGETLSVPVFVHDGPIGREAWLVVVSSRAAPARWLFVTPSFVYERPAGTTLEEGKE